ncbi:poly-gamma-glutamate hydrolase family protein [Staphylococcus epidermidis]|uniref:poly-gamma-glutamate hydrolase family protein n=1 Tax=Staphylococcus epidermidis TaxID=1282 RepID=UPI0020948275|nr:poly-gamma-glutamate hydrolase family protein [Staphylococcus epidermidis]MCO6334469.1 poly-gamma-glutamate hydrolase family protein [Staphylococcus epidermidis]MCO6338053.1 poly-gamma-glutamate hydrolase family protein [Staphylococcus epidermidis]
MKVKSISRFFSMKKVTLSFVTLFIGVGTIGSYNQYADASTKTQQTHVTKTSPTQKTTSNFKRSVKDTSVKSRATSNKRAISPKTSSTKKTTTVNKTRTTTKTQPTIRKSSTTSTRSKTMPTSVKRTTSHKATTVSPTSKAKISTKTQQSTKSHTTTVKKNTTQLSKTKSPSTSTESKTVQSSTTKAQPTLSTQASTTTKAKQLSTPTTSKTDSSKALVSLASTERKVDKYQSMTQLEKETTEGVDWRKDTKNTGNQVLIVAPHGGSIEQGTTELTKALANKGNYDYYSFEGIRPKNNSELHVTSTHYDDPTLNQMIKNRTATISIHGASGSEEIIYLGGPRSDLRNAIEKQLVGRGFTVKVPPEYLGGQNNKNFINREDNNTGVQLELTTALRKAFFKNGDTSTKNRTNKENWTPTMEEFINALYEGINQTYS